jgi:hypothetical protein
MRIYKLEWLQHLKTLESSQTDDLKYEDQGRRLWLSRMTIEDGMPYNNQVTEENFILQPVLGKNGQLVRRISGSGLTWQIVRQYEAK